MSHLTLAVELRDAVAAFLQVLHAHQGPAEGEPPTIADHSRVAARIGRLAHEARNRAAMCQDRIRDWEDFAYLQPEIAGAALELSRAFAGIYDHQLLDAWEQADTPWAEDLRAKNDRLTRALRGSTAAGAGQHRLEIISKGGKPFLRVDADFYALEDNEARYCELLLASRGDYLSFNEAKKDPSAYLSSHPERILSSLKRKLPEGVIETGRKGSRIVLGFHESD